MIDLPWLTRGVLDYVTNMTSERVTVTISSSAGEGTLLTVPDAMRQLLDFFDLLSAASGEEGKAIAWQLVDIPMNSPLRATAQAVSKVPGVLAEPIARREKGALRHSLQTALRSTQRFVPPSPGFKDKAKALFSRNTDAISEEAGQGEAGEGGDQGPLGSDIRVELPKLLQAI